MFPKAVMVDLPNRMMSSGSGSKVKNKADFPEPFLTLYKEVWVAALTLCPVVISRVYTVTWLVDWLINHASDLVLLSIV